MDISEIDKKTDINGQIKTVTLPDENCNLQQKRIVKGARLKYYPAKFNILRCSRGIKRPEPQMMSQEEACYYIQDSNKTFERTVKLSDPDSDFETVISTAYYNKIRGRKNEYK